MYPNILKLKYMEWVEFGVALCKDSFHNQKSLNLQLIELLLVASICVICSNVVNSETIPRTCLAKSDTCRCSFRNGGSPYSVGWRRIKASIQHDNPRCFVFLHFSICRQPHQLQCGYLLLTIHRIVPQYGI